VAEGAEVDELEAQGEEHRAEDQPQHHQRHLDGVPRAVVPERDVEEDDGGERLHDDVDEEPLEQAQESSGLFHAILPWRPTSVIRSGGMSAAGQRESAAGRPSR
jgi:hypothetical protein